MKSEKREKTNLDSSVNKIYSQIMPKIDDCIKYVESLGYQLVVRKRGYYVFEDVTGKRPIHCQEMVWNLSEMRHAVKFGC